MNAAGLIAKDSIRAAIQGAQAAQALEPPHTDDEAEAPHSRKWHDGPVLLGNPGIQQAVQYLENRTTTAVSEANGPRLKGSERVARAIQLLQDRAAMRAEASIAECLTRYHLRRTSSVREAQQEAWPCCLVSTHETPGVASWDNAGNAARLRAKESIPAGITTARQWRPPSTSNGGETP